MAVDTTQSITVTINNDTAQALWAAMHDDDDLASDYADLAVIHALNHLIAQVDSRHWPNDKYARIIEYLGVAKAAAIRREDDVVQRFMSYDEPPF